MELKQQSCRFCGFPVSENFYFCPGCGKKLIEPPITLLKTLGVYAISIFLPPFGLVPAVKYLLQNNPKSKKVGIVAIILTIISTIIAVWLTMGLINQMNQSIMQQANLDQYKSLGL
jgi:uncharacterized membrane protein YqaE (UPF0057 family)